VENLLSKDIRRLLPHREPFLFIDKIISAEEGVVTASKYIKKDEEYLKGHFPGNPLVPGVLLIESMAQASGLACALYMSEQKIPHRESAEVYFLSRVSDVKFKRPVMPGDILIIKSKIVECFRPFFKAEALCEVNGKIVAEGELVLTERQGGMT